MYDEFVTILDNKKINEEYYKLTFASSRLSKKVFPGQFLNIQIQDHEGLLLRRPFSYYRVSGNKIEILYEILGRGTSLLAQKRKGHKLKALGPLGLPFSQNINGRKRILIAGGVGVPPLVYLAETLSSGLLRPRLGRRLAMTSLEGLQKTPSLRGVPKGRRSNLKEISPFILLIGCKSKKEVLPKSELSKIKGQILYATNDGSYGRKGFVTILLHDLIKAENPKSLFIQTCGPNVMMSAVMNIAKEFGVEGEASVDERMACGVGACLGCVVETHEGFKTSCVEGPVFSFSALAVSQ